MPSAENDAQFSKHAGTVLWPTSPAALTDTTACPACFTPLTGLVCRNCGLDLGHPAAHDLAEFSRAAADALAGRVGVIGRIRYETSLPPVAAPEAFQVPAPAREPQAAAPTPPPPVDTAPRTPAEPRRSGVQVALLIAGVSLLSVFAIFFLVYAFINYGIVWRSVIIGAITVAAFVSASLLRRKALIASAEGLAVFAVVLVYLDAYAIRVNDFFSLGSTDAAVYWGATVTIASLGFIAWHRMSMVRSASIIGWAALGVGAGILVWGLADGVDPATRAFAAFSTTAAVGLSHALIARPGFAGTLERMLVLSTVSVALITAFTVSWVVEPLSDWGGTVACGLVAVLAFLHAAVATVHRNSTSATIVFGRVFATIGGISTAAAASVTAVRVAADSTGFATFVPVVAAVAVALVLEAAGRRMPDTRLRRPAVYAAWGAAGVLALAVLSPLADALAPIGSGIAATIVSPLAAGNRVALAGAGSTGPLAVIALSSVVALAAAIWLLSGMLARRGSAVAWGASVVLILAAAHLPSVWLTLGAWLLLAALAFALLLRFTLPQGYRPCLIGVLSGATALLLVVGWGSIDTWAAATVASITVLVASRILTRSAPIRAALLGTATGLFFLGVAATSYHLTWLQALPRELELANIAVMLALVAPVVLGAAALGYRRALASLERRTVFWIAGVVGGASALTTLSAVTSGVVADLLLLPQPAVSLVSSVLLFCALVMWVALRANAALRPERIAASIAVAPTVLWLVDSFARLLGLAEFVQSVVPITAALLTAAGALAFTLLKPTGTPRWAREAGVALVGVPAVLSAVATDTAAGTASGWLVLILAAVTVLLSSISPDGLFGSESGRRHLGWVALALATAGLWWRLATDRIDALEPYVLPLAAALLVIAYLIHRASSRAVPAVSSRAAPIIALGGLLVGVLPLAANSITGELVRAVIIFAASALLLIAGSLLSGRASQPYLDAVAVAGAVGVATAGVGRAIIAPGDDLVGDYWMVAVLAVLSVAAVGQARRRPDGNTRVRRQASQALVGAGIVGLTAIEAMGFSDPSLGTVRAIATVALLGCLHVIAFVFDSEPLTRAVGVLAIAFGAAAGTIGVVSGALDPIEVGTVPLAIAMLVTGRIRLATEPAIRSWRALAPGITLLLVPSLLATITEPVLWRLVGLGVVAVTVLIVGAVRRLQAPFVLGLVVALVHGFATFAPQIRAVYESQEWWLWAGLAGVVLVALAIRYERRIQNVKDAVGRIAALR